MTAGRNRTITLSDDERTRFLNRCIQSAAGLQLSAIADKTIIGDIFQIAPQLPDSFVDLLVVDPPYNLTKQFHTAHFKMSSNDEYRDYTRQWMHAVRHTLKPNATIYVCCDWRSSIVIGEVVAEFFQLRNRITWQREKGRGAKTNWKNAMEDIWFATASQEYTFHVDAVKMRRRVLAPYRVKGRPKDWEETEQGNFRDTYPSNFWDDISIPYWSMPENTQHPTQKPEKLAAKLILASSNPGDVILDPFVGSGTTSVVAKKLSRHYVGIDMDPYYCALTEKRLELAEADKIIQGYTGGVFWERNTLRQQLSHKDKDT